MSEMRVTPESDKKVFDLVDVVEEADVWIARDPCVDEPFMNWWTRS